jgi:hypothetical protein
VKPRVSQLAPSGATTGQAILFTGSIWAPGAVVSPSIVDAKGDLLVGTAADVLARLPVGTNDQVLIADSTVTAGVRWGTSVDATKLPLSLADAKGDLLVASANDAFARLAVGTDGQLLTADAASANGVKWAAPPLTGVTVQDENGAVSSGVTQIDFQGSGVTASSGTGEVIVTINGAGEILMVDGSIPPEPVTTEDGTDYLYQG